VSQVYRLDSNRQWQEILMTDHPMEIHLSQIDEDRFGIRAARAKHVTSDTLSQVLDFCHTNGVVFLIARCSSAHLDAAQAMEQSGFLLMDTLVYFKFDFAKKPMPEDKGDTLVRPMRPGEAAAIKAVAVESFKGYFGHYHADPRLDRSKCDETYTSWADLSATSRDVADEVLVADIDGQIAGFATLRLNRPEEGEGVLFGVAPFAQGRGIYRAFMVNALHWVRAQGCTSMVVSTQITNIAVQKVWSRLGFEPNRSYYTFHKWFD
jgi:GNAT superfamily N-acetyltransferase